MRRIRAPAVYILTNRRRGTLYIGVTSDLCSRVLQHREGKVAGFTKTYGINTLVWFESHDIMETAIERLNRQQSTLSTLLSQLSGGTS